MNIEHVLTILFFFTMKMLSTYKGEDTLLIQEKDLDHLSLIHSFIWQTLLHLLILGDRVSMERTKATCNHSEIDSLCLPLITFSLSVLLTLTTTILLKDLQRVRLNFAKRVIEIPACVP